MLNKVCAGSLVSGFRDNGVEEILWNNQISSRDRKAYLILVKDGVAHPFKGASIAGVGEVLHTHYYKAGKWSSTDYNILLAPGTVHFHGHLDFDTNRICGRVENWGEVATQFGCTIASIREAIGYFSPKEVEMIDVVEEKIASIDDLAYELGEEGVKTGNVHFGCPCNRDIANGYWHWPRPIPGGEIRKIDPERGWCIDNLEIVGVQGRVLDVKHVRGMHGGWYDIRYAIVPGTEYKYQSGEMLESAFIKNDEGKKTVETDNDCINESISVSIGELITKD